MAPEPAEPLATLLDKQAITEVLHRYCRAVDRMDRDIARAIFLPGARIDYGERMFQGTAEGLLDFIWDVHPRFAGHSHQIANILIELAGEHATSESYLTAALWGAFPEGALTEVVVRGRYLDRWARHDGGWVIAERRFVEDHTFTNVRTGVEPPRTAARRDRRDPLYGFFSHGEDTP
jgi:hypothetical protein